MTRRYEEVRHAALLPGQTFRAEFSHPGGQLSDSRSWYTKSCRQLALVHLRSHSWIPLFELLLKLLPSGNIFDPVE